MKRIFETPEIMWEHFEAYCKWTKENPKLVHDFVGKNAKEVLRKKERPISVDGFVLYCQSKGLCKSNFDEYFTNKDGAYNDYSEVCSRIRLAARVDQIEGGMAGIYNPSITQRLNSLVEKTEQVIKEQPMFGPDANNKTE